MTSRSLRCLLLAALMLCPPALSASKGLLACASLPYPFSTLAVMVLDHATPNPPQVQLCHRLAGAARHYEAQRSRRAIDELISIADQIERSAPRHLDTERARMMVAEIHWMINLLDRLGDAPPAARVTGGVFMHGSLDPVPGALISLIYARASQPINTTSDAEGLFSFDDLEQTGMFMLVAEAPDGSRGSAMGSLVTPVSSESVSILIDQPGIGRIEGRVTSPDGVLVNEALVTVLLPETQRQHVTHTDFDGNYVIDGLRTDGSYIVVAFDSATGASASHAWSGLTQASPLARVDLELSLPSVVHEEFVNHDFSQGLEGWTITGNVRIVDSDLYFGEGD